MTEQPPHEMDIDMVQCLVNFSDTLWTVHRVACACSGSLSIIGSSLIIYIILTGGPEQRARVHNRLLLCLSAFDIVYSLGWSLSTLPVPRDSICTNGAFGNHGTCVLQGLMLNFGIAVPHYNVALCLYFIAVIRYNATEDTLKKFEPFMHVFGIFSCAATSIFFLATDKFNSRQGFCWIEDRCRFSDGTCRHEWESHKGSSQLYSLVYVLYTSLLFIIVVLAMLLLFWTVWDQERTMKRYQFNGRDRRSSTRSRSRSSTSSDTAKQASLYVFAFFVSHSTAIVSCILDIAAGGAAGSDDNHYNNSVVVPILLSIFQPLQGFMNFLTFLRPRYCDIRLKYPEEHFMAILNMVIFQTECRSSSSSSQQRAASLRHIRNRRQQEQDKKVDIRTSSRSQLQQREECEGGGGGGDTNIEHRDMVLPLVQQEEDEDIEHVHIRQEQQDIIDPETNGHEEGISLQLESIDIASMSYEDEPAEKEQYQQDDDACLTFHEIFTRDITVRPATPSRRHHKRLSLPTYFLKKTPKNSTSNRKKRSSLNSSLDALDAIDAIDALNLSKGDSIG